MRGWQSPPARCKRALSSILRIRFILSGSLLLWLALADLAFATKHWRPPMLPSRYMLTPHRNLQQRKMFMTMTGYPNGRVGFRVDHRHPIKRGGLDVWWNMDWLEMRAKYLKDRWE